MVDPEINTGTNNANTPQQRRRQRRKAAAGLVLAAAAVMQTGVGVYDGRHESKKTKERRKVEDWKRKMAGMKR